jgi:hypothetical protein
MKKQEKQAMESWRNKPSAAKSQGAIEVTARATQDRIRRLKDYYQKTGKTER